MTYNYTKPIPKDKINVFSRTNDREFKTIYFTYENVTYAFEYIVSVTFTFSRILKLNGNKNKKDIAVIYNSDKPRETTEFGKYLNFSFVVCNFINE